MEGQIYSFSRCHLQGGQHEQRTARNETTNPCFACWWMVMILGVSSSLMEFQG